MLLENQIFAQANNKGSDQPGHLRCLICSIVIQESMGKGYLDYFHTG